MHKILLVGAFFSKLLKFEVDSGKDFRTDPSKETGSVIQKRDVYDVCVIIGRDVRSFWLLPSVCDCAESAMNFVTIVIVTTTTSLRKVRLLRNWRSAKGVASPPILWISFREPLKPYLMTHYLCTSSGNEKRPALTSRWHKNLQLIRASHRAIWRHMTSSSFSHEALYLHGLYRMWNDTFYLFTLNACTDTLCESDNILR